MNRVKILVDSKGIVIGADSNVGKLPLMPISYEEYIESLLEANQAHAYIVEVWRYDEPIMAFHSAVPAVRVYFNNKAKITVTVEAYGGGEYKLSTYIDGEHSVNEEATLEDVNNILKLYI